MIQHRMAWHGMAWRGIVLHDIVSYCLAWRGMASHRMASHRILCSMVSWYGTRRYPVLRCMALCVMESYDTVRADVCIDVCIHAHNHGCIDACEREQPLGPFLASCALPRYSWRRVFCRVVTGSLRNSLERGVHFDCLELVNEPNGWCTHARTRSHARTCARECAHKHVCVSDANSDTHARVGGARW